ncbi:hypothetical protein [Dethiobacter alkaliphilus]|uniref:DUF5673 domain-containing protein n=1 Tax=Dethiobacter alkaliphilus AHT 1 TaxID=555088 RepID=C0GKH0_DETAL|nr:hypothetical protein [Dethiobacter alkaliphilus]EEG76137.1 hypothetical protein DealDRAFT_2979 [Dethiobacter alkaliphilus AHT 1]
MKKHLMVKPSVGILGTALLLPVFIAGIGVYYHFNKLIGFLLLLVFIYCVLEVINVCFFRFMKFDEEGVEYRTPNLSYKMRWDDIGSIGVTNRSPGFKKWIYFSLKEEPNYVTGEISQDLFVMNYRKSVIDEVQKYWSKEINGLQ